jgi:DNA repair protein RecO (recombination protein O)
MLAKAEGIVLRTVDYGEGNKIITVFTKEMGKIGMVARGARKTKSKLGAVSQPFTVAHFIFYLGTGLATISQGEIIESHSKIRNDLYKAAYAAYLLELTDRMTEEKQRIPALYEALCSILKQMEDGKDSEMLTRIFELKALSTFGYHPSFENCMACGRGIAPWLFSVRESGLLCAGCRYKDPYAMSIGEQIPRILQLLQRIDIKNLGEIRIKESTREQLKKVIQSFMDEYVGIVFKSRVVLEQILALEQQLRKEHLEDGKTDT